MNHPLLAVILKHISTHADGVSYDVGRVVLWVTSMLYSIMGIIWMVYCICMRVAFDFMAFGGGYAAMMAGAGILIAAKAGTEPKVEPPKGEGNV